MHGRKRKSGTPFGAVNPEEPTPERLIGAGLRQVLFQALLAPEVCFRHDAAVEGADGRHPDGPLICGPTRAEPDADAPQAPRSLVEPETDIAACIDAHTENPKPNRSVQVVDEILPAVRKLCKESSDRPM